MEVPPLTRDQGECETVRVWKGMRVLERQLEGQALCFLKAEMQEYKRKVLEVNPPADVATLVGVLELSPQVCADLTVHGVHDPKTMVWLSTLLESAEQRLGNVKDADDAFERLLALDAFKKQLERESRVKN